MSIFPFTNSDTTFLKVVYFGACYILVEKATCMFSHSRRLARLVTACSGAAGAYIVPLQLYGTVDEGTVAQHCNGLGWHCGVQQLG